jgi:hypothetical protein
MENKMSNLLRTIAAWFALQSTARPTSTQPDDMSIRDWADLPPHHPLCP